MNEPSPRRTDLVSALDRSGADLVRMLADTPDDRSDLPVAGLAWTVGQTAAHLLSVVRRALGDTRRSTTPEGTATLNATALAEIGEDRPSVLATLLRRDLATVTGRVLHGVSDLDRVVPFHGGLTIPVRQAFGIMLVEIVVHTDDLARTLGRPAPVRPDVDALALDAFLAVAPRWVDPGSTAAARITLRSGTGAARTLRLTAGSLDVKSGAADPGTPVVDDRDLLLVLCRRRPADGPLGAIRGALRPI